MTERIRWFRRRPFQRALLIALVALALPVAQGIAGAGSSASSPVQYHNGDCGGLEKGPFVGKTTFQRSGNTLKITHKVSGADPGQSYDLYVYDDATCGTSFAPFLGSFRVDSSGSGGRTSTVDVTGWGHKFFVCDYNEDTKYYDCGLTVKV